MSNVKVLAYRGPNVIDRPLLPILTIESVLSMREYIWIFWPVRLRYLIPRLSLTFFFNVLPYQYQTSTCSGLKLILIYFSRQKFLIYSPSEMFSLRSMSTRNHLMQKDTKKIFLNYQMLSQFSLISKMYKFFSFYSGVRIRSFTDDIYLWVFTNAFGLWFWPIQAIPIVYAARKLQANMMFLFTGISFVRISLPVNAYLRILIDLNRLATLKPASLVMVREFLSSFSPINWVIVSWKVNLRVLGPNLLHFKQNKLAYEILRIWQHLELMRLSFSCGSVYIYVRASRSSSLAANFASSCTDYPTEPNSIINLEVQLRQYISQGKLIFISGT